MRGRTSQAKAGLHRCQSLPYRRDTLRRDVTYLVRHFVATGVEILQPQTSDSPSTAQTASIKKVVADRVPHEKIPLPPNVRLEGTTQSEKQ